MSESKPELVQEPTTEPKTEPRPELSPAPAPVQEPKSQPDDETNRILEQVINKVDKIETTLQEFSYKEKINKELHEELQRYKSGLRRELTMPLLKHIMLLHGRLMEMHNHYANNTSHNADTFKQLLLEYKKMPLNLTDLLRDYEIEPLEPKIGDEYQPNAHEAVFAHPTDVPSQNRTIVSCEKAGFVDMSSGRVLKRAEVTIFKLSPVNSGDQESNSITQQ